MIGIGTHIGLHTLTVAKIVEDGGGSVPFESDQRNFDALKKNM